MRALGFGEVVVLRLVVLWVLSCPIWGCAEEERPPFAPKVETNRGDGGLDDDDDRDGGTTESARTGFVLSGKVEDWGASPQDALKICTGNAHSCGITVHGEVVCWGWRESGVLDIAEELSDERAVMIACGENHVCALGESEDIYCWGTGRQGQLDVPNGSYKAVSAGALHNCAIDDDDELVCWGAMAAEDVIAANPGLVFDTRAVQPPRGKFRGLSAGPLHNCAISLDDDRLHCWGAPAPFRDLPTVRVKSVSAGWFHTCAIDFDDEAICWGEGADDENAPCTTSSPVGNGAMAIPGCGQGIPPPVKYSLIASGASHSCGISLGLALTCWGSNYYRQTEVPAVEIQGVGQVQAGFAQVATGTNHTCAITSGGNVECWGYSGNRKTRVPAEAFDE